MVSGKAYWLLEREFYYRSGPRQDSHTDYIMFSLTKLFCLKHISYEENIPTGLCKVVLPRVDLELLSVWSSALYAEPIAS